MKKAKMMVRFEVFLRTEHGLIVIKTSLILLVKSAGKSVVLGVRRFIAGILAVQREETRSVFDCVIVGSGVAGRRHQRLALSLLRELRLMAPISVARNWPLLRASFRQLCKAASQIPSSRDRCRRGTLFGGSIFIRTAALRSAE